MAVARAEAEILAAPQDEYMSAQQFFGTYGGLTNPLFKSWFTSRRNAAQTVAQ